MGVETIPMKYRFTCDVCQTAKDVQSGARPSGWEKMRLERDAYDYQGMAVADASVDILLCNDCAPRISRVINEETQRIRHEQNAELN